MKEEVRYGGGWGKCRRKEFGKWRMERGNIVMEWMENVGGGGWK